MASRKMTFTLPEDIASQFLRRVPARNRSRYVAEAIAGKLREREERLIRACQIANQSPKVKEIEEEWEAVMAGGDPIEEPWNDGATR
jgi:hypothetical protein